MEYRILGPLEVLDDGDLVDVGSRQQRALLAMLLLNLNRVVSTERILEEFWPDDPIGKEKTLWVYISRLRGSLEPNREAHAKSRLLVTRDHGYSLLGDVDTVDAHRFELQADHARSVLLDDPATALTELDAALGLWRGAALEDFAYEGFAQAEAARLEETRIAALEDRVDAQIRLGRHREMIGESEMLVRDRPLRERPVSLQMLALYRSGRQADALRAFERYRKSLGEELGVEPSPELRLLEEQVLLHDSRLTSPPVRRQLEGMVAPESDRSAEAANPFKGLQSFSEADVGVFFGRDKLIGDLVRRISAGNRLLALVGASGSGKSSVLKAGVIPALRKGAVDGSDRWLIAQMVPGSRPFTEAEAALSRATLDPPPGLGDVLEDPEDGLLRVCLRLLPEEGSKLVLVIDQFEELFTLVPSDEDRDRFIRNLEVVLNDPHGRVIVIIALRADFYSHPLAYARFGRLLGEGIVNAGPLTPDELEAAAEQPAARAGVELDPAVVVKLLSDVAGEVGALPMFQYTLTELFDRRRGNLLTTEAYEAMGGVRGALARRAEDLFLELNANERMATKQLFLRLVTTVGETSWGRRRALGSELVTIAADIVALQRVLNRFGAHRLVTFDRDVASGSPTVEVAHEALLEGWPRLREWLEQGRGDIVMHNRLTAAMTEWSESGEKPDYLLSGDRLRDYEDWAALATLRLSTEEERYLDQSIIQRETERVAEEARTAREVELQRRARSRLRGLAIGGVTLAVVALGALGIFLITRPPEIAVVHTGAGDQGVNDMMVEGAILSETNLEIPVGQIALLTDHEAKLRELAASGVELIVVPSEFDVEVERIALDYPDTHFVALDPTALHITADNITEVHFEVQQSAYAAGVAAGMITQTGTVGFIGGFQVFPTESARNGFEQGVTESQPDVEVVSIYLGPTLAAAGRPDLAYDLAREMYSSGIDVIYHDAGLAGTGVVRAAAELSSADRHLWAIGSDADEFRSVPQQYRAHVLTSTLKQFDKAVEDAIDAYLAGTLEPGERRVGMTDGAVSLSRSGGHLEAIESDLAWYEAEGGHLGISTLATRPPGWQTAPDVTVEMTVFNDRCTIDTLTPGYEVVDGHLELKRGSVLEVIVTNRTQEVGGISLRGVAPSVTIPELEQQALEGIPEAFGLVYGITLVETGASTGTAALVEGGVIVANCILHESNRLPSDFPALMVRPAA